MRTLTRCLILSGLVVVNLQASEKPARPYELNPDPTRFADQVESFRISDEVVSPPKGAIVCTGSSSMRMWHPSLQKDLEGLSVIPRGFGGSHYSDVIHYAEALIFQYEPRALLLYEGDNDAAAGKSPERIFADFKLLASQCRKHLPELRFYIIGAKPSISRWAIADQMQSANAMIEDYCLANEGFTYIDVWPALLDTGGQPRRELFVDDMLHLNAAGYEQWSKAITPIVKGGEAEFE